MIRLGLSDLELSHSMMPPHGGSHARFSMSLGDPNALAAWNWCRKCQLGSAPNFLGAS